MMGVVEILGIVAVPTIAGAIAWGRMNQRVDAHTIELALKAPREVVEVQFDAVIERLERIERKLDRNTNGDV